MIGTQAVVRYGYSFIVPEYVLVERTMAMHEKETVVDRYVLVLVFCPETHAVRRVLVAFIHVELRR